MQLGTCKGGVEAEGSHCRKQGRLALVHPELAITRHLQAPKSVQAQDTAQGQVEQVKQILAFTRNLGIHSSVYIFFTTHEDKYIRLAKKFIHIFP